LLDIIPTSAAFERVDKDMATAASTGFSQFNLMTCPNA
jgi:hypothetical protein